MFREYLDALDKVLAGLSQLAALPKVERQRFKPVMSDTYLLIDTAFSTVIIRLVDILHLEQEKSFLFEVKKTGNSEDWRLVELVEVTKTVSLKKLVWALSSNGNGEPEFQGENKNPGGPE